MKKFFKVLLTFVFVVLVATSFAACSPAWSGFSSDTTNVTSNSGIAVKYNDYLYFINGTKETSADANKGNLVLGAIYKVKLNNDGSIAYSDEEKKTFEEMEKVVNALVGFDNGSIHIFGNYLYYATTSNRVNSDAETLYGQIEFARKDLISGNVETFYTTKKSDDTISYAYYFNGDKIDFVIYEKDSKLLSSFSIGDSVKNNFVKTDITSAIFSDNFGMSQNTTESVVVDDADCYIYYTKAADADGAYPDGNRVYYATSDGELDRLLNEKNESVTLLAIRSGKLIYTVNSYIYADSITASDASLTYDLDTLDGLANILSYKTYDNNQVMFIEKGGHLVLLVYEGSEICIIDWQTNYPDYVPETIYDFGSDSIKVNFIGIDGDYLVITVDNKVNKIKIFNTGIDEIVPIALATTQFEAADELMAPKIVDGYVYGFATKSGEKYMYRVSLAGPGSEAIKEAEFVGMIEED